MAVHIAQKIDGKALGLLGRSPHNPRQHLCYVYASLSRLGFRGLPEKLFIVFEGVIGFSTAKKPTALMMHWWNGGRGGGWQRAALSPARNRAQVRPFPLCAHHQTVWLAHAAPAPPLRLTR